MSLTKPQIAALKLAPFHGFRPGSNLWSEVAYTANGKPGQVLFDGEEIEPLVRAGLLAAEPLDDEIELDGQHSEIGKVSATHVYRITEAGALALKAN